MRILIIGGGSLGVTAARVLLERDHEVVIVEKSRERIDELSDELDCGLIHGDGTKPAILKEANGEPSDILLCLTNSDQDNIITSLVGKQLGFERVVTKIEDSGFQHICVELGLEDTIVPDRTIARSLAELVAGHNVPELSAIIKGDVSFFSFVVPGDNAGKIAALELPGNTRLIGIAREDEFLLGDDDGSVQEGDEVLLLTHGDNLESLRERWQQQEP